MRAQLLDASRPTDLVDLVDRLTLLQIDPTSAIAPNADLVTWSRLGASYRPADLTRALEERTLFELRAFFRGTRRTVASGSRRAQPTLCRSHGSAVTVRPTHPRPRAYEGSLRLRLHPGDVEAGSEPALGLLRPARASPRPPRRQAGRQGRPQGGNIHHQRPAPGRALHQGDSQRRGSRDRGARRLVGTAHNPIVGHDRSSEIDVVPEADSPIQGASPA